MLSAFFLDLLDDPDAPIEPIRLGGAAGGMLSTAGVDHVAINLRQSGRPVSEVMDELAAEVMPMLAKPE